MLMTDKTKKKWNKRLLTVLILFLSLISLVGANSLFVTILFGKYPVSPLENYSVCLNDSPFAVRCKGIKLSSRHKHEENGWIDYKGSADILGRESEVDFSFVRVGLKRALIDASITIPCEDEEAPAILERIIELIRNDYEGLGSKENAKFYSEESKNSWTLEPLYTFGVAFSDGRSITFYVTTRGNGVYISSNYIY